MASHCFPEERVQLLASAYRVAGYSGAFHKEGIDHLRSLWKMLDPEYPKLSLLSHVKKQLNEIYRQEHADFLGRLSLLRFICWEFVIDEEDLEHALWYLDPPGSRIVKLLGLLDLGVLLTAVLRLGDGGKTRARFQLVALANRLWRHAHNGASIPAFEQRSPPVHFDLWDHARKSFRLYATILIAVYAPRVVKILFVCNAISILRRILLSVATVSISWWSELIKLCVVVWLVGTLSAYRQVMLPRVSFLTVRQHLRLVKEKRLREGDYSPWHPS
mmetsp:Transcript_106675/g.188898  ORF Transcript_106675/g.188898 Transcript_106675/m.188898 type:complete len:274 (+) Transcript_106675:54-875(+)